MSKKIENVKKGLKTFEHLEKKGKTKPSDIDKMVGCFEDLFPKDKSSVDMIREERARMFDLSSDKD